ncbi:MAG: polymerase beta domain protein region [Thermoleophilia bacterium]|nr:polymerase beta domain protein region [Thermoleophilia bacterium]
MTHPPTEDLAAHRRAAPVPGEAAATARALVVDALRGCDAALAAWEGGSAGFGRADELSDLDIGVLCIDGGGRAVLDAIEAALRGTGHDFDILDVDPSLFGIQRFWQARDPLATLAMVDASVIEHAGQRAQWEALLVPERHGRAIVLHDPDGVLADALATTRYDLDAHRELLRAELARIRSRRRLFGTFAAKELTRGRRMDAEWFHQRMVLQPLVTLLCMWHRPLRHDFGLRYLHDELPEPVASRLAPIVAPASEIERARATVDALAWTDELLDLVDVDAAPLVEHSAQLHAAFG